MSKSYRCGALTLALIPITIASMCTGAYAGESKTGYRSIGVTETLGPYMAHSDALWTGIDVAQRASGNSKLTDAQAISVAVRDQMEDLGTPIVSASSAINVTSTTHRPDGTIVAKATVTTLFEYGGAGSKWPGDHVWSEEREILLDSSGASPIVVSDTVIAPLPDDTPGTPAGPAPVLSSSEPIVKGSGEPEFSVMMQPTPDVYEMQGYAWEWTSYPYDGNDSQHFNPLYPYYSNNCANFVSQVLRAGGWTYQGGVNPYDTNNWSPNLTGPGAASRTWSSSKYQYTFVNANGYDPLDNIWNADAGDILYTDWDPNNTPDGELDHVMFVAYGAMEPGEVPLIAQKSPNRSMIPLTQTIANANAQGKTINWYGLSR